MIEISGLTKSYGSTTVLDGIDLTVADAQIGAVVGPSGAGKSTLARTINLLERPTSGTIAVNGRELTSLSGSELRAARREIGTVFQSANLLRRLTAAENVALPLRHHGVPDIQVRRRVHELLERVGMLHRANHYPSQLSGGQRQRIGIARGLALKPSVLLSDEATSGLDPDTTLSIITLLRELRDDLGVTILVITHEMDVVRGIADQVARLDHGRIVERGSVADVVRGSDSDLSRALLPLPPAVAAPAGHRTWTIRYDAATVSPYWVGQVGREVGTDLAVLSALVEEAGRASVGRVTIGVDPRVDERRLEQALVAQGLVVEQRSALRVVGPDARPGSEAVA
ncbi:methionine ABC transporter ATP-binding protein [Nocardioides jiangxiensis]|uniref:ATP-binding cassette domain-containing protein n=1 Tax=Nocardioides jiangxiensis TaxID=3064524 RepID=A0ABT9B624_9ACTN|nr:ATP-binding cassette domain-containing protein [Nocardioides sp. WY-20]MDO7868756.1 ATP-binding cassette domain-containing protein [Nocardioides sp. WY-20]